MDKSVLPEISVDISKLPSRGLPYPNGSKLSYRTYSFGEVKNASVSNLDISRSMELAISGITCDFGSNNLTVMDALYLGLMRKISSFNGVEFFVPFVCPKCGNDAKDSINHSQIEIEDISEDVTALPIVYNVGDNVLKFSPMTVKTYLEIHEGKYTKYCGGKKINKLTALALCCTNKQFEDTLNILNGIYDQEVMEDLNYIDGIMLHGVEPVNLTCKNLVDGKQCNYVSNVKLEGLEHLLKPFREGGLTSRSRICFGDTPAPEPI